MYFAVLWLPLPSSNFPVQGMVEQVGIEPASPGDPGAPSLFHITAGYGLTPAGGLSRSQLIGG